jgi:hypothetical protein
VLEVQGIESNDDLALLGNIKEDRKEKFINEILYLLK